MSSSFTSAQLDAIEASIATGTLSVEYDGKKVVYRSLEEMIRVRDLIRRELGLVSPQNQRVLAKYSSGHQ